MCGGVPAGVSVACRGVLHRPVPALREVVPIPGGAWGFDATAVQGELLVSGCEGVG